MKNIAKLSEKEPEFNVLKSSDFNIGKAFGGTGLLNKSFKSKGVGYSKGLSIIPKDLKTKALHLSEMV